MELKKRETYKSQVVPLEFEYKGTSYKGEALPISSSCSDEVCYALNVRLNAEQLGTITCARNGEWKMSNIPDQGLVEKIGEIILLWYE